MTCTADQNGEPERLRKGRSRPREGFPQDDGPDTGPLRFAPGSGVAAILLRLDALQGTASADSWRTCAPTIPAAPNEGARSTARTARDCSTDKPRRTRRCQASSDRASRSPPSLAARPPTEAAAARAPDAPAPAAQRARVRGSPAPLAIRL